MTNPLPVLSFAKLEEGMPMPHLLDIQTRAFQSLLEPEGHGAERSDMGLERVFKDVFPIQDVNGNYSLEFVKYALGEPKYSVEECIERDMTYSVPLKATLQLVVMEEVGLEKKTKRPKNIIEKEVYLGELPILTPLGTFVINGAERVIVSQLHRSPGVVFEESIHPNGQRLFSARIIPFRGSWVEFTIDIHDVIYVHIDKKKKFRLRRCCARSVRRQCRHPEAVLRGEGDRHHRQARGPRPEARGARDADRRGCAGSREQEG